MANTFLMNNKKEIIKTQQSVNYQNENNCEVIRLILPAQYNNIDLGLCKVNLNYLNSDSKGDIIPLEFVGKYDDANNLIVFETNLTQRLTANIGDYTIWFEVIDIEKNFILKTNTSTLSITFLPEITDYISNEQLTLFSHYQTKIEQLLVSANQILNQTKEQSNTATDALNKSKDIARLVVQIHKELKGG